MCSSENEGHSVQPHSTLTEKVAWMCQAASLLVLEKPPSVRTLICQMRGHWYYLVRPSSRVARVIRGDEWCQATLGISMLEPKNQFCPSMVGAENCYICATIFKETEKRRGVTFNLRKLDPMRLPCKEDG